MNEEEIIESLLESEIMHDYKVEYKEDDIIDITVTLKCSIGTITDNIIITKTGIN